MVTAKVSAVTLYSVSPVTGLPRSLSGVVIVIVPVEVLIVPVSGISDGYLMTLQFCGVVVRQPLPGGIPLPEAAEVPVPAKKTGFWPAVLFAPR